jgi:hypothetical protein
MVVAPSTIAHAVINVLNVIVDLRLFDNPPPGVWFGNSSHNRAPQFASSGAPETTGNESAHRTEKTAARRLFPAPGTRRQSAGKKRFRRRNTVGERANSL